MFFPIRRYVDQGKGKVREIIFVCVGTDTVSGDIGKLRSFELLLETHYMAPRRRSILASFSHENETQTINTMFRERPIVFHKRQPKQEIEKIT